MNGNKNNNFTDNFTNIEIKILELVKNKDFAYNISKIFDMHFIV